jgi:PAS domain S-box-containing protein
MSKGSSPGVVPDRAGASRTVEVNKSAQTLLSRPEPVFVFQRGARDEELILVAQNDAAAQLVDAEDGDGSAPTASPAADPQIRAFLRSCLAGGVAAHRFVVWRSLASGEERLMRLAAEPHEGSVVALHVEDRGGEGESRRRLAVMHALAELSAGSTARSDFLGHAVRLVKGYLGTGQVSFCEKTAPSPDLSAAADSAAPPEPSGRLDALEEVPVRADGELLGLLRVRTSALLDVEAREFLETVCILLGEGLRRMDQEALLKDSEEYYHLLASSTDSAIVIFDAQGKIKRWNAAAERMYEYATNDVIGESCSVLYQEEDVARGKPEEDLRKARQKGSFQEEEAIRRRKDGQLFVVSARTTALVDANGRLSGYARTLRDITARKRSETELHRNLAALDKRVRELRCLYQVSALISDQALPLASVMQGVTDLVARAYQYPDITCVRIRVGEDVYDTPGFQETTWEQTSTIGTLSHNLGTLQVCYREERPEADEGPFSEEERDLIESIGQLLGDFLEGRITAEALRRSNALLETLFASTNYKIAFLDNDFRYIRVNESYARSWGHEARHYVGRSHLEFFPDDGPIFREVLRTGTPYTAADKLREVPGGSIDRSPSYWDWELFPMSGEGIAGLVLILVDRTRRHRARKELETSREELRKLASHLQELREEERKIIAREIHDELGGLLTALKMEISLLGKGGTPLAGSCLDSYDSALGLVDQSISMVQRITSNLRPRILDDFGLVPAMEWHLKDYQKRSGITCTLKTGKRSLMMEKNRAAAVFRIFQEALTNVARHANATSVTISLRAGGGRLRMRVADNGMGIDESRVVAASSYGIMGMRERAQSLGGQVSIRGITGKGTTLELEIPLPAEEGG